MLQLNEEDLDDQFDQLVAQGHLIYGPSTITSLIDDGVQVIIPQPPEVTAGSTDTAINSLSFVSLQLSLRSHTQRAQSPTDPKISLVQVATWGMIRPQS